MRNTFTSDDHDPGDEDSTECVKRALLELLDDGLPDPSAAAVRERHGFSCFTPSNPTSLGNVWIGTTQPTAASLAEILGLGRG